MLGSGDMRRPPLYLCPPPKAYDCQHIFHKLWIAINNLLKHYPQCAEKWDSREFYLWGYLWLLPYDAKEGSEAGHLALLSCNWGWDSHVYRTWPLRVLAWSLQAGERTCLYLIVSIFTIAPSFSLFSQWRKLHRLWMIHKVRSNHHIHSCHHSRGPAGETGAEQLRRWSPGKDSDFQNQSNFLSMHQPSAQGDAWDLNGCLCLLICSALFTCSQLPYFSQLSPILSLKPYLSPPV